jgi:hypothetical protein
MPITVDLPRGIDEDIHLAAIGPHDIAYIMVWGRPTYFVAVAPSGAEITRKDWPTSAGPVIPRATGLVGGIPCCTSPSEWPWPNAELVVPWVDLDGNPITDTRPYPTATDTDAGIEVRLGEREWLVAGEALSERPLPAFLSRSDGGVAMVLDTLNELTQPIKLLELLPDGTIEHFVIGRTMRPSAVLPDGSLIVEHNLELVRLTPPT